jgi:hypothetical protein
MKLIPFPQEEHTGIQGRLARTGKLSTTRVGAEYGQYLLGDVVLTPWQQSLRVVLVQSYSSLEDHPYRQELTPRALAAIGAQTFEVVWLEVVSGCSAVW